MEGTLALAKASLKAGNFGWPSVMIKSLEASSPQLSLRWLVVIIELCSFDNRLELPKDFHKWLFRLQTVVSQKSESVESLISASKVVFNLGPDHGFLTNSLSRAFAAEYEYRLGNIKKYESAIWMSLGQIYDEYKEGERESIVFRTYPLSA